MSVPYTYLIGWKSHNVWYYGVRFASGCSPTDLFNPYKTSSKKVKKFIAVHGPPDIIQVRKVFINADAARQWESKVLQKMNVISESKWLNDTNNKAISREMGIIGSNIARDLRLGTPLSKDHKLNIAQSLKGHVVSDETRRKISETRKLRNIPSPAKGRSLSNETKNKMSLAKMGKPGHKHTEKHKQYMSNLMKGKNIK